MPRTVAAVFPDRKAAEQALADVRASGLDPAQPQVYSTPKPPLTTGSTPERAAKSVVGAAVGSLIIGTIGAIIGWICAVLAAGGVTAVTFAVIAVACVGGMIGWLLGGLAYPGTPVEEGEYYQEWVEQGRSVLTFDARGHEQDAQRILAQHGAQSIQAAPERRRWGAGRRRALPDESLREPRGTALN
ncbi:MAG TPA: hypothetical protein VJN88_04015 [Ktedonobacterales bacterium]|nr:hypothetical protein [Ktedonobacterales bacterium]